MGETATGKSKTSRKLAAQERRQFTCSRETSTAEFPDGSPFTCQEVHTAPSSCASAKSCQSPSVETPASSQLSIHMLKLRSRTTSEKLMVSDRSSLFALT